MTIHPTIQRQILEKLEACSGYNTDQIFAELKKIPSYKAVLIGTLFSNIDWVETHQEIVSKTVVELFPNSRSKRLFIINKLVLGIFPSHFSTIELLKSRRFLNLFKEASLDSDKEINLFLIEDFATIPIDLIPTHLSAKLLNQYNLSSTSLDFLDRLLSVFKNDPLKRKHIKLPPLEIHSLSLEELKKVICIFLKNNFSLADLSFEKLFIKSRPLASLHPECPRALKTKLLKNGELSLNQWIQDTHLVKGVLKSYENDPDLIETLLLEKENGFNLLERAIISNKRLIKPMLDACAGNLELKRKLFQPDWLGNSPLVNSLLFYPQASLLLIDACEGDHDLLKLLLKPNPQRQTAFTLAAEKRWPAISKRLLEVYSELYPERLKDPELEEALKDIHHLNHYLDKKELPLTIKNKIQRARFIELVLKKAIHLVFLLADLSPEEVIKYSNKIPENGSIIINQLLEHPKILKYLLNSTIKHSLLNLKKGGEPFLVRSVGKPEIFKLLIQACGSDVLSKRILFDNTKFADFIHDPYLIEIICESLRGVDSILKNLFNDDCSLSLLRHSFDGTIALIKGTSDSIGPHILFHLYQAHFNDAQFEKVLLCCLEKGASLSLIALYKDYLITKPTLLKLFKQRLEEAPISIQFEFLYLSSPSYIKEFILKHRKELLAIPSSPKTPTDVINYLNPESMDQLVKMLPIFGEKELAYVIPFITDVTNLDPEEHLAFTTYIQKFLLLKIHLLLPAPFKNWDNDLTNPHFLTLKRGIDSLESESKLNRLKKQFKQHEIPSFQKSVDKVFQQVEKEMERIRAVAKQTAIILASQHEVKVDERFIDFLTMDLIDGDAFEVPPIKDKPEKRYYIGQFSLDSLERNPLGNVQHPITREWISPSLFTFCPELTKEIKEFNSPP